MQFQDLKECKMPSWTETEIGIKDCQIAFSRQYNQGKFHVGDQAEV